MKQGSYYLVLTFGYTQPDNGIVRYKLCPVHYKSQKDLDGSLKTGFYEEMKKFTRQCLM